MNLLELKTPFHLLSSEEKTLFIRNLRYTRTLNNAPPKKEKKERKKKDPLLEVDKLLNLAPDQMELFLALIQKEKEKGEEDARSML